MADICKAYGHEWQRDLKQSVQLPPGYKMETCAWCDETRTVLERA